MRPMVGQLRTMLGVPKPKFPQKDVILIFRLNAVNWYSLRENKKGLSNK